MKIDFRALRTFGAALLLGVSTFGASGCSDEPTVTPPAPRYAPITVFNAVYDINTAISFKIGADLLTANATYGNPTVIANALVGNETSVEAYAGGGSSLGIAKVHIDTNRSIWVIAAGEAIGVGNSAVFGVSHAEKVVPVGRVLIRAINASNNAPTIDVRLEDASGAPLASDIAFKGSGDFVTIAPTTLKLSVIDANTDAELLLFTIPAPLVPGKIYNFVVYGSTKPDALPAAKLQAKLLEEPA